jgi:hypothetical protein
MSPIIARGRIGLALASVIALGLVSRLRPIGWSFYDKSLGDVLYAVAAYCAIALMTPARWWGADRWRLFGFTTVLCVAIEFFQATGVPAQFAHLAIVRWLIGTTFAWHDIACYIAGTTTIFVIDRIVLRPGWSLACGATQGDLPGGQGSR